MKNKKVEFSWRLSSFLLKKEIQELVSLFPVGSGR